MKLFGAFSGLAVFIACLGSSGLAAVFAVEQRTKEIGIRKVLGASVSGLVAMFSREFARWILVANLLAWPVASQSIRAALADPAVSLRRE